MSSYTSFALDVSSENCGSVLQPNTSLANTPVMAKADSTAAVSSKTSSSGKKRKRVSKSQREAMESSLPVVKHHHSVKKPQTPSVSRRNARERNRVKQVNNGFTTLRNHIPNLKNKTSKVDTLRAAVDYIKALRRLVGEEESGEEENVNDDLTHVFLNDLTDFDSDDMRSASGLSNDELNVYNLPSSIQLVDTAAPDFGAMHVSRSPSMSPPNAASTPTHTSRLEHSTNTEDDDHHEHVVALVLAEGAKENAWWTNQTRRGSTLT